MTFRLGWGLAVGLLIAGCTETAPQGPMVLNVVDDKGRIEGLYASGAFDTEAAKALAGALCIGDAAAGYVEQSSVGGVSLVAACANGTKLAKSARVTIRKTDPGKAVAFREYSVGDRFIEDQVVLTY